MLLGDTDIIWMAPDGSWGRCYRQNLLIVDVRWITDDEWEVIHKASACDDVDAVYKILFDKVNG